MKDSIFKEIRVMDLKEETRPLTEEERFYRVKLKETFQRKLKEEDIKWKQRSWCNWLKEGDRNIEFFHGMTLERQRANRISFLLDGETRLENSEDITNHIEDFFVKLHSKDDWKRPSLDNLEFPSIGTEKATWL